jgi:hypothetical protein
MAALMGHLRCDNLKLQEALAEYQQLLTTERAENERLQQELDLHKEYASGAGKKNADELCQGTSSTTCDEKLTLEQELIRCKIKCAEAVDRADGLEELNQCYTSQLALLSPSFKPLASDSLHQVLLHEELGLKAHRDTVGSAEKGSIERQRSRKGRRSLTSVVGRMFKPQSSRSSAGMVDSRGSAACVVGFPPAAEDMSRQREVIACLMAELEKSNRTVQHLQAKFERRGKRASAVDQ